MGLWGEDKTAKTTLALTAPKPLRHIEFDIGGFARAAGRFNGDIQSGAIKTEKYILPLAALATQVPDKDTITLKQSKLIIGMKELWYEKFLVDYYNLLNDESTATVVIDTSTVLWEVCRLGYLQEKQEAQLVNGVLPHGEKLRERLAPIEHAEPNTRMRHLLYLAQALDKNLVLTHHSRSEYKDVLTSDGKIEAMTTGNIERAGWAHLGDIADILVHTYLKNHGTPKEPKWIPWCRVDLCGICLEMQGQEVQEPTWDKLINMAKMLKGESVG